MCGKTSRCTFDPTPCDERPHPARLRFKLTQVGINRLHLLLYAPVCSALHPSADLLEDPFSGIQLRTVWRLDDRCESNTPYHLATVTTRPIPHQGLDIRVMLQAIDCHRYSRRLHRVDPTPQQPAPPNVYHQEQVHPLVHQLHSLMYLHSTTTPYPTDHPPQSHSHLIGKAKGRLRTHARSGKATTEAPFFHDSCAPMSAFS